MLAPGARLGPYEIVSALGAGGMGEVYKARDTRLARTVAIKVLPEHLSDHEELRQRFEQEARAVSSLNHPNICTLYDVGREGDVDFLVMELLEGETLADRLDRGSIPWSEAVSIASRLADALDKAHRAGVVHRDLKPANVILGKSGPKLLDFGLAKRERDGGVVPELSAVTEAKPLTEKGTLLGTFQYMSPEQLEAKEADARSDIFALGAVLHEMVTGEKAFRGTSQASLIAAILKDEPRALSETGVIAPEALDRVIRTCLAKDPDERWQTASDLKKTLGWVASDAAAASDGGRASRASGRAALFGLAGLAAGGVAAWLLASTLDVGADRRVEYFDVSIGENEGSEPGVSAWVALSPEGELLAYTSVRGGTSRLYLRRLDEPEEREVPGSEGARSPFFSPDGEWVAFQTYPNPRTLKRASVHGGPAQTVYDGNRLPLGGTWLSDDTIVFVDGSNDYSIYRVPVAGGDVERIAQPHGNLVTAYDPQLLPGEQEVLVTTRTGVAAVSLSTGESRELLEDATNAQYAERHLLFVRGGSLWVAAFDPKTGDVGSQRPLVSNVEQRANASFSVSDNGRLAYVPGAVGPWVEESLTWMDESGDRSPTSFARTDYEWPRISPKGDKIAIYIASPLDLGSEIWILDIENERQNRWTFHDGQNTNPTWTPDAQSLVFASDRGRGSEDLYIQPLDQSSEAELLLESEEPLWPLDIAPDGSVLAFERNQDIYFLSLGDRSESPFAVSAANESNAKFSPDGRFLAYVSDESGRDEVYVQPYPPTGAKRQVSREGGSDAMWAEDGSEIYYLRDRTLMAARVRTAGTFEVLGERKLFDAPINRGRNMDLHWPSGRFIVVDKTLESPARYVRVVTNVLDLIEAESQ